MKQTRDNLLQFTAIDTSFTQTDHYSFGIRKKGPSLFHILCRLWSYLFCVTKIYLRVSLLALVYSHLYTSSVLTRVVHSILLINTLLHFPMRVSKSNVWILDALIAQCDRESYMLLTLSFTCTILIKSDTQHMCKNVSIPQTYQVGDCFIANPDLPI